MRVIAVNGSPRRGWNTDMLLNKALEGASSQGAETEFIHLFDLKFTGCSSCFSCKRKGSKSAGHCSVRDGLYDCIEKIISSDAVIFGSPIYFGNVTGGMACLLERLLFSNHTYNKGCHFTLNKKLPSGFIYTMNVPDEMFRTTHYEILFDHYRHVLDELGGYSEYMTSKDTYQFDDYSKYETSRFDLAHKAQVRARQFPKDLENAYSMGARLATIVSGD